MLKYNEKAGLGEMSIEQVAIGFVQVANETMCRAIRAITQVDSFGYPYQRWAVYMTVKKGTETGSTVLTSVNTIIQQIVADINLPMI